jgi:cobalt-zinc-cadmium resistance protein CzcA
MERLVVFALHSRGVVIGITVAVLAVALWYGLRLRLDALPDVTSNQVLVLTRAPGLTPEEVERLVTRRVETALGGVPGLAGQRSISRYGISSVTALFGDDVDAYRARQVVQERLVLLGDSLPPGVEAPELGPLTGGLGEIYHFAVTSSQHTDAELFEIVELTIAPLLRAVPGVVEVNSWGGRQRTMEVVAKPSELARRHLTLDDLAEATRRAIGSAAGASLPAGSAQVLLRGIAWPRQAHELAEAVVRADIGQPVVRIADVADVREGSLPRIGTATWSGRGETVYVMVQMLRDENALAVMHDILHTMPAVARAVPKGVKLSLIYDRSDLVNRTLHTVGANLAEGGLLVIAVLFLLLGSLRAGILVALVIPMSMIGASAAMVYFGVAGNLMSLGALDFGLLVDGAVVMVEGLFHALKPHGHDDEAHVDVHEPVFARMEAMATRLARPVFYSVLVIILVYVPILTLQGVDGKMFRPMALTVIFALVSSLILAMTFVPALASLMLRPKDVPNRPPPLIRFAEFVYRPMLAWALRMILLGMGAVLFARAGTSFVPQLDEGDLVVQSTRAPDISIEAARDDAMLLEKTLLKVPEVVQVVSRVGSPAVATDIMGLEQADVFVKLKPRAEWRKGLDREKLIAELEALTKKHDPTNEASFTQPIQMRFNELVGGSVTDVDASVYGEDLGQLRILAEKVRDAITGVPGAEDVKILAPPAVALIEVRPKALEAAQWGLPAREVLDAVAAVRTGIDVGVTYDGPVRIPVRLRLNEEASAFNLANAQLPTRSGQLVELQRVAHVESRETPGAVQREAGQRRLVVGFNVRGGDLGEVVAAAQAKVKQVVDVPNGFRVHWGGQFETFQAARARMAVVIPVVLIGILLILLWTFGKIAPALLILLNVPFAAVGGVVALTLRDLPISMSAAVGFIALSGIAVLNGVVLMSTMLEMRGDGLSWSDVAEHSAKQRMRPVLMTALVAMLGFVPMMLATGAGAEVQRPLATVVVGGLVTSTALTLVVLPALVGWFGKRHAPKTKRRDPADPAETTDILPA